MKISVIKKMHAGFLFLMLLAGAFAVRAQTTEFVYQGQLQNASAAANGSFDFEFLLYDSLSGGSQAGSTLTRSSVAVASGIFSVKLDFGLNYPGATRFLEIHVRQSGGGAFTALAPRQPISNAPYSVKSLTADSATSALNSTNSASADTLSSACVGCVTGAKIASGQVVKSLNGLSDNVTISAGSNITLVPSGNTLTINAPGGSSGNNWSLTGNAGTTPTTNFVGTTDNQPMGFRINGAEAMRMIAGGNVGLGTQIPLARFHVEGSTPAGAQVLVRGTTGVDPSIQLGSTESGAAVLEGLDIKYNNTLGETVFTNIYTPSTNAFRFLSGTSERVVIQSGGNVGIGTPTPGFKLDVADRMRVRQGSSPAAGVWFYQNTPANDRAFVGMVNDTNVGFFGNTGAGFGLSMDTTSGNVGIGTSPFNNAKLSITGSATTFYGVNVSTPSQSGIAVYGSSPHVGVLGQIGLGSGIAGLPFAKTGVWGDTFDGDAVLGTSSTRSGVVGISDSGTGVVGASTSSFGVSASSTSGTAINGVSTSGTGVIGAGKFGVSGFGHTGGYGGYFNNVDAGQIALFVEGTGRVNVLQIAGGSDMAEKFAVAAEAKPGLVVVIDPDNPGRLSIAGRAYDRRVAGVISGANKLEAGMVLSDLPGSKNSLPVALSGRVWVYCDASRAAIRPGDFLTTSNVPGHAMKATNRSRAQGATIGKAMTGLGSGRGLVLVLVTLQ